MLTFKDRLEEVLEVTGDTVDDLEFVIPQSLKPTKDEPQTKDELLTMELPGKGAYFQWVPVFMAFSKRFVYFRNEYDGHTFISTVPRNPDVIVPSAPICDTDYNILEVSTGEYVGFKNGKIIKE